MGKLTLFDVVRAQWTAPPPVVTADLTGKTVMVIGANTGIGFEACKHFARMNPTRLIMACRNKEKGEAAVQGLRDETGYQLAELWMVDLSHFASVTAFADKFESDGGRLDILVQNAAVFTPNYETTPDGWEATLQVNSLSQSLIALRLFPCMVETSKTYYTHPRLVMVNSDSHHLSKIEDKVLNSRDVYQTLSRKENSPPSAMPNRYSESKMLNVLFYLALNKRIPKSPTSVIVCGVNPGVCYSEIRRSFLGFSAIAFWIMEKILAWTAEQGSRQLIYAAIGDSDEEDKFRGAYVSSTKIMEANDAAINAQGRVAQGNLWDETMDILVKVDPHVQETVYKYLVTPLESP